MPIRDHFHPPLSERVRWEEIHTVWIASLTRNLNRHWLPEGYRAAPERHFGPDARPDVSVIREPRGVYAPHLDEEQPAASYEVPAPDATITGAVSPQARVLVHNPDGRLVAVVELISPGNKDDAAARMAFAGKLESYLRTGVAVVVVDIVTSRRANLHNLWVELHGASDTPLLPEDASAPLSVVAYHPYRERSGPWEEPRIDLWLRPLRVGQELPVVPLFLTAETAVPLELERTYLEACSDIRLPDAA